jgi:uncharacterized membrane protein/nitrite reductase/ring-hydroxylating ferredoxin subunit
MVNEFLQGKPFRHPLHTLLAHFPIGLFALSLCLDTLTWLGPAANAAVRGAFYAMAGGVALALLAAFPGLADWNTLRTDHPAKKTALAHLLLNLLVVGLFALNLLLRLETLAAARITPVLPFGLSVTGMGLLAVAGYLGGRLVYEDGVGVGRHRRRTPTPQQTFYLTRQAFDGLVAVAPTGTLLANATLRVDLDGEVMTIVKISGDFYAFQEFCTHRYAPLSEGSFHAGQVMCPWHGSCFGVRTGKVTHGPATVGLKTFPTIVRGGVLCLRVAPSPVRQPENRGERSLEAILSKPA